jgi:hypothetical protein
MTSPHIISSDACTYFFHLKPQLRKVYEPHNQRLFKFLGYSIPEWYDEGLEGTAKSEEAAQTNSLEGSANPDLDPGSK